MDNIFLGLSTSFIGLSIVLIILILIAFMIYWISMMAGSGSRASKAATSKDNDFSPREDGAAKTEQGERQGQSREETSVFQPDPAGEELVAVITAAIAAATGQKPENIRVRAFRKVTAWNDAARREQQRRLN